VFLQWVTTDAKRLKKLNSKARLAEGVLEQLVNCFLEVPEGSLLFRHNSPKASNGQRFPCPALLSPWFSWGEAGQRPNRGRSPVE